MTGSRRILVYTLTVAVIAAIAALCIFFLGRSARDTVSHIDYALSLGSSELFADNFSDIYKLSHDNSPDYVYVKYLRHDDTVEIKPDLSAAAASELTPYQFAYAYYSGSPFVRGDGSIWLPDYNVASADGYIKLIPCFTQISTVELTPAENHKVELASSCVYGRLNFNFTENRKLFRPEIHLSVKLNDGKWYRLNTSGDYEYDDAVYFDTPLNQGWIDIPRISASATALTGHYRLEIYERRELYTAVEFDVTQDVENGSTTQNITVCDAAE